MVSFGELAEFKLTGWDGSDRARTAYVNDALNWVMMSRANAAGYRAFDLGGLPPDLARLAVEIGVESALRNSRLGVQTRMGWPVDHLPANRPENPSTLRPADLPASLAPAQRPRLGRSTGELGAAHLSRAKRSVPPTFGAECAVFALHAPKVSGHWARLGEDRDSILWTGCHR